MITLRYRSTSSLTSIVLVVLVSWLQLILFASCSYGDSSMHDRGNEDPSYSVPPSLLELGFPSSTADWTLTEMRNAVQALVQLSPADLPHTDSGPVNTMFAKLSQENARHAHMLVGSATGSDSLRAILLNQSEMEINNIEDVYLLRASDDSASFGDEYVQLRNARLKFNLSSLPPRQDIERTIKQARSLLERQEGRDPLVFDESLISESEKLLESISTATYSALSGFLDLAFLPFLQCDDRVRVFAHLNDLSDIAAMRLGRTEMRAFLDLVRSDWPPSPECALDGGRDALISSYSSDAFD